MNLMPPRMDYDYASVFRFALPPRRSRTKTKLLCLGAILFSHFALPTFAENATITIDLARPGPAINPRLYGIFLEEINHGVDGGLYAELIRNRGFEDARPPRVGEAAYPYTGPSGHECMPTVRIDPVTALRYE